MHEQGTLKKQHAEKFYLNGEFWCKNQPGKQLSLAQVQFEFRLHNVCYVMQATTHEDHWKWFSALKTRRAHVKLQ